MLRDGGFVSRYCESLDNLGHRRDGSCNVASGTRNWIRLRECPLDRECLASECSRKATHSGFPDGQSAVPRTRLAHTQGEVHGDGVGIGEVAATARPGRRQILGQVSTLLADDSSHLK